MGKVFQLLNKLKNHLPACHVAACRALLLAQEGKIQPIFYNLEFSSGTLQVFYTLLLWSFPAPYFYSWLLALQDSSFRMITIYSVHSAWTKLSPNLPSDWLLLINNREQQGALYLQECDVSSQWHHTEPGTHKKMASLFCTLCHAW